MSDLAKSVMNPLSCLLYHNICSRWINVLYYIITSYFIDGNRLQVVSKERDLGVIMSEDLKWEKQCVAAVKLGNKILGMIKRRHFDCQ